MVQHWLLRVGDGVHFRCSSKFHQWGIESSNKTNNRFQKEVKKDDILWFVRTKGILVGVATYVGHGPRVLGDIIDLSKTNKELGWTKQKGEWDIEVHYKDLYDIEASNLHTGIKGACVIRLYNEKCLLDLPKKYQQIIKKFEKK